ncbi:MAG TPA: PhzF family phenazine biosynthesis protein [Puia sp.]|uniref:PhzF family phenazine biosynthesis protein n=1 Tax=Puia sp. TaxID=2045100 RepID=UPI002CF8AFE0|nr:PhzF family phenazine biosynthesis protein [Puia sp.]HVU97611.1 PhzF family phenazine biosynthesis protein [Puia sp.]
MVATELIRRYPTAVIPLTEWLPDPELQGIAMENNLPETAFFIPEDNAYSIRWFSPIAEIFLCGYATLAAGHVLFHHLGHQKDRVLFHTRRAGDLEVIKSETPGTLTLQGRVSISGNVHTLQEGTLTQPPASITLREAQKNIDDWIRTTGVRYFSELTNMAILTEEVGEVARLMSRLYGDQSFKESDKDKQLADELADVLWVLCCIANQTGVDLTTALQNNFIKKNVRDSQRHKANEKLI